MKKILVISLVFATVFFLFSCDSGRTADISQNDSNESENSENSESDTPEQNDDSVSENENFSEDESDDSTYENSEEPDDSDTRESEHYEQGDLYGECYPNETCNTGLVCDAENNICIKDPGNSSGNNDNEPEENPCKNNPCSGILNSTGVCNPVGSSKYSCGCYENYTWNGSYCKADSRTVNCTGLPANASWNTASSITQIWTGYSWVPSNIGTYSKTSSNEGCYFQCNSGYDWNGSQCVEAIDPCDPNPCNANFVANATGICIAAGAAYACECKPGYSWKDSACISNIPACSKNTPSFPCKDESKGYFWSAKSVDRIDWESANELCNNLNQDNYGGFNSGWHLPNIDELRTLLINSNTGSCKVSESCGSKDHCWSCVSCAAEATASTSGNQCALWGNDYKDGRYSKLGDTISLWSSTHVYSSSHPSETDLWVWDVNFLNGSIKDVKTTGTLYVRCVRNAEE